MIDFAIATQNPSYQWEPKSRRYRDSTTGKFLSKQAIAQLTQLRIAQVTQDLHQLGDLLVRGKITLRSWQEQFARSLKILHAQQYLLGVGGQSQIQKQDYLVLARELKSQYKYLRNFAIDLTRGVMSPAQFKVRAAMYAKAAKVSYFRGEKQAAVRSGLDGAYRVLGEGKYHCIQCPQYAAMGVVPIDKVIYPTQRCDCMTSCLCSLIYTKLSDKLKSAVSQAIAVDNNENFDLSEYLEFTNPYRDEKGRFAKKNSTSSLKSIDELTQELFKERLKKYRDNEAYKHFPLKNGQKYDEILKSQGEDAANKAYEDYILKTSVRLAEEINQKAVSDREVTAFERLYPNLKYKSTLEEFKKENPEIDLLSRLEAEEKLDQVLSYDSIMERGINQTKRLNSKLSSAKNEEEKLKIFDDYRNKLLASGMPLVDAENLTNSKKIDSSIRGIDKEITLKTSTEFYQITRGAGSATLNTFKSDEPRAYATLGRKDINIGSDAFPSIIYHEMGHHAEYEDERIAAAARNWRDKRGSGEQKSLGGMYASNEKAIAGKYISPYVGKVYANGFTEVISMGMERFHSSKAMLKFYEQDKEHFQFIIGLIRRD